jgi:Fe-S-cluster-containing dehydrogenase component
MHWGMVIDLKLCVGCNSCVMACKVGRGTPRGIFWNKILEEEIGIFPRARRVFWPVRCMQCEDPACLRVCPTGATYRREDGIVMVNAEVCVGCKACVLACPYGARAVWEEKSGYFGEDLAPYEEMAYKAHRLGAVQKCDFCAERLSDGLQPHCVETCPTGALIFGDLDNPKSEVSQALNERRLSFKLKDELGTKPSISYLGY